ncbi:MAG: lamin tail domain-containing protein, partial [Leptospiraceae bacterium]|nr:lamin tail domain-containing protein [Leptospiraceae bacterium]
MKLLVGIIASWVSPLRKFFLRVWRKPNFLFLILKKFKLVTTLFLILLLNACYNEKKNNLSALSLLVNGWANQALFFYSNSSVKEQSVIHEENLSRILDVAQKTLHCSFYDVNLIGIIDKLKLAKQRNVKVRVAIDEDNLNGIGYIELSKFLITFGEERELWIGNRGAGQNYFHGCVADNSRGYILTSPPTLQGLYYSSTIGVYIQSHEDGIIRKFSSALELLNNGAFGSSRQRLDQRNYWLINSRNIGVYLAPEENPIDFLEKRVGGANDSIYVYTTEFLSNKTKDEIRTSGDISYEIRFVKSGFKQIIGSWYAHIKADEKSFGDCSWNHFFGVACDPNKSEAEKENSPRRINSLQYLRNNGISSLVNSNEWFSNRLNLFFIDVHSSSPMAIVSSAPFSSRTDSSHDGVIFLLEDRATIDPIFQFYLSLLEQSRSFENVTKEAKELDVVISELNWAGGINRQRKREASEYIELYNNREYPINLENWKFECGSNQNFSSLIAFPKNTIIGARSYFLIADEKTTILQDVHLKRNFGGFDLIADSTTEQCRLLNSNGDLIDIVGVNGIKFVSEPLKLGMLDIDNNIIRSMERIHLMQKGDSLENWHTNSHSEIRSNINLSKEFIYYTFGTPGYENSANVTVPVLPPSKARNLVINEIGVNYPNSNDRWVEIYNPLNEALNLNELSVFLVRDSSCSLTGGSHTGKLKLTGVIPANGYYLVVREDSPNFASLADQTTKSGEMDVLAGNCIFLSIGESPITSPQSPNVIDFVNIGGTGSLENNSYISSSSGFYSRCPNGLDTNVNAIDFKTRPRTPKAENLCTNPTLVINEIGRETGSSTTNWIELYNPSSQSIDLSLWEVYLKRDSGCTLTGSSHTASVALTGVIPPNGYYLIVRSDA